MVVFNLFPARNLLAVQSSEQVFSHLVPYGLLVLDALALHGVINRLQVIRLHVNREKSHWFDTTLHRYGIDLTAHLLELH